MYLIVSMIMMVIKNILCKLFGHKWILFQDKPFVVEDHRTFSTVVSTCKRCGWHYRSAMMHIEYSTVNTSQSSKEFEIHA
jgi:RNase P subunit RPR2